MIVRPGRTAMKVISPLFRASKRASGTRRAVHICIQAITWLSTMKSLLEPDRCHARRAVMCKLLQDHEMSRIGRRWPLEGVQTTICGWQTLRAFVCIGRSRSCIHNVLTAQHDPRMSRMLNGIRDFFLPQSYQLYIQRFLGSILILVSWS